MNNLDGLNHTADWYPGKVFFNKFSSLFKWLLKIAAAVLGTFILYSLLAVALLCFINPPTTSFMLQHQYKNWSEGDAAEIAYDWRGWKSIDPSIKMAAITSEDQRFAEHWGVDLSAVQKAVDEYEKGQGLRGASTITQQTAKNLFLWPGQSYLRKGMEAYLAMLMELCWGKQRILEVYLNIVEFGEGTYGVEAAAQRYFDMSASELSAWESSLMATALPAPKRYNLANPSQYMLHRRSWILKYMDLLGTHQYLNRLK